MLTWLSMNEYVGLLNSTSKMEAKMLSVNEYVSRAVRFSDFQIGFGFGFLGWKNRGFGFGLGFS